ncbi:MAG: hypothetical protein WCQ77_09300 [Planctomycetota bacterium]
MTALDGSIVETIARVARLSGLPKAKGASLCDSRLHTQFKVLRGIPSRIDVTPANPVRIVTVTATHTQVVVSVAAEAPDRAATVP